MGRSKQILRQFKRISPGDILLLLEPDPQMREAVEALARAMDWQGQREPVLVTPCAEQHSGPKAPPEGSPTPAYRLVQGRKRLLAARRLGWREMDCIVLGAEFAPQIRIIESLDSDAWEPLSLADALVQIKTLCGWTQAQLGVAIGRSRDFVANILAIANITPKTREYIENNGDGFTLTARHLRYIGRTAPNRQLKVAREMLSRQLSTKLLEERRKGQPTRPKQLLPVKGVARTEQGRQPRTEKEWRRYLRKVGTDLRRLERQEKAELERIERTISKARERRMMVRTEAREKRRVLMRERKRATRRLIGKPPARGG